MTTTEHTFDFGRLTGCLAVQVRYDVITELPDGLDVILPGPPPKD